MLEQTILLVVLTVASVTDLRERLISNKLVAAAAGLALLVPLAKLVTGYEADLSAVLIGGAACFALMFSLWLAGAAGGGDAKLAFAIGALLGWRDGVSVLVWGHLLGAVVILAMLAAARIGQMPSFAGVGATNASGSAEETGPMTLPMAPLFALGALITVTCGGLL